MNVTDAAISGRHAWSLPHAAEVTSEITPELLESWVTGLLDGHKASLDRLLAATERTLDSTWRPYDDAMAALSQAGSECGLLDSVHPSKPVRDKAQQLAQRVAEAATALSLNQDVYRALAAVDARGRPMRRRDIMLSERCCSTGWPAWTRTTPPGRSCASCRTRRRCSA